MPNIIQKFTRRVMLNKRDEKEKPTFQIKNLEPLYDPPPEQKRLPDPIEAPSSNFFDTLEHWWVSAINYKDSLFEYIYPQHWRSHDPTDPIDIEIIRQQKLTEAARLELTRNSDKRKKILRDNFSRDVGKAQQKENICKNWYNEEVSHLTQKKDQLEGIVPQPGDRYDEIPGWVASQGDSNYRGNSDLCYKLQCASEGVIIPKMAPDLSYQTLIQNLKEEAQNCRKNNVWKTEELKDSRAKEAIYGQKIIELTEQCKIRENTSSQIQLPLNSESISVEEKYRSQSRHNDYGSSRGAYSEHERYLDWNKPQDPQYQQQQQNTGYQQQQNIGYYQQQQLADNRQRVEEVNHMSTFQKPRHNAESYRNMNHIQNIVNEGNLFEQFISLVILPIEIVDSKSLIWKRKPPIWPLRYVCSILMLIVWYQIAMVLFRLCNYAMDFLPSPPKKEESTKNSSKKKNSKKRKKEEEKEEEDDGIVVDVAGWIKTVLGFNRGGGGICVDLRTMDPIFIWIHIEKIRSKVHAPKPKKNWKRQLPGKKVFKKLHQGMKFNKAFLLHLGLALATISNSINSSQTIRQISVSEEAYKTSFSEKTCDTSNLENIRRIEIGDKVLTFSKEEPAKTVQKNRKLKKAVLRRAKVVRLSDLPPLSESDFDEIISENTNQNRNRIRVR